MPFHQNNFGFGKVTTKDGGFSLTDFSILEWVLTLWVLWTVLRRVG